MMTMTGARWSFAVSTVGTGPAYFPGNARCRQSCQLFVRGAICWHVPSWLVFMLVSRMAGGAHVYGLGCIGFSLVFCQLNG